MLAARIARAHGLAARALPWGAIGKSIVGGLAARGVVNLGVALVPGVAAVANALTAVALTEVLGRYIDQVCDDPEHARPLAVGAIADMLRERAA